MSHNMQRALSILVLCFAAAPVLQAAEAPNIVLIVSDDQGWRDFGFMGHGVVRTPHLDRLAEMSAVFPNGYVPTALCRPSLATLLTGLYPHQHKITGNDPPEGVDRGEMLRFIGERPTVPRLLGNAGYVSLQTGKFWEGHYSNAGFTEGMTTEGRHGGPGLKIGRETMQPLFDFITANHDKPFFLWYAPLMPHGPHNPPESFLNRYRIEGRHEQVARYFAMVEWFDETCGELLGFINAEGLRENTLVIFLIDNGWEQLTKSEMHPFRKRMTTFSAKSKASPYDGGVRTPIMLRWPGRVQPGRYLDLASTVDIAPTILAAAGLDKDSRMSGLNLLDVATGRTQRLKRDAIFGAAFEHTAVSVNEPIRNLTHRWVRQRDWKLIVPAASGSGPELYNVALDPTEARNLAPEEPARVEKLKQVLDHWWELE